MDCEHAVAEQSEERALVIAVELAVDAVVLAALKAEVADTRGVAHAAMEESLLS